MKRYHLLGAGLALLYISLLLLRILPAGLIAFQSDGRSQIVASLNAPPASIALTLSGVLLWFGYLRAFAGVRLPRINDKLVLALHSLGLGFGISGLAAWLHWAIFNGANQILFAVTLAAAVLSQTAAWSLESLRAGPDQQVKTSYDGGFRDYIMLTKPIVLALLLVTTLAAMIVAAEGFPAPGLFIWTMIGGAFSAGGASALNQYIDRVRDSKMTRTKRRPLPEGRLDENNVILFGTLLCLGGFYTLAIFVNLLSAVLALAGIVYYVVFYSLILKPTTTQNIVIGGGAGAIPPLVGWAAAAGELSMPAFFLFALVFFWTPPHFWALALLKRRDYARAGVPMLPVIHGPRETRWQIMLYTVQVVALTLLLPLAKLGGQIYFFAALLLGGGLVFYAWRLWRNGGNQPAHKMYRYSSTYLALIFAALVADVFI